MGRRMTNTQKPNFISGRTLFYLVQLLFVVGVLGVLWLLDPLGWRHTATLLPLTQNSPNTTLGQIETLQNRLNQDAKNQALQVQLATLYLQYVRESGDPSYYNKADVLLHQAYAAAPNDLTTLLELGNLSLSRHDFHAALDWGTRAAAVDERYWLVYGILGDANVELGNYDAAEAAFDKMVSLRPDINSYARISYMRELLGDTDGAIQAMSMAVRVGMPNTEPSNWVRVQLGNLYFNQGKLDQAEALYQSSLDLYPNYLHALAGMGKVRAARGDYDGAVRYYQQALRQIPIPEYVIALGDVYAAAGKPGEAKKQYDLVGAIQQLYIANGVDTDMELALFNADHEIALDKTLARARAAYARRPSIYGADVLAWVLYQNGKYLEAQKYSQLARRLGMQDALKYYHAGMIALQLGQTDQARANLKHALDLNPHFSLLYAQAATQTLAQLH
jgi:tetratricopeptide (TPR) repeat protein